MRPASQISPELEALAWQAIVERDAARAEAARNRQLLDASHEVCFEQIRISIGFLASLRAKEAQFAKLHTTLRDLLAAYPCAKPWVREALAALEGQ